MTVYSYVPPWQELVSKTHTLAGYGFVLGHEGRGKEAYRLAYMAYLDTETINSIISQCLYCDKNKALAEIEARHYAEKVKSQAEDQYYLYLNDAQFGIEHENWGQNQKPPVGILNDGSSFVYVLPPPPPFKAPKCFGDWYSDFVPYRKCRMREKIRKMFRGFSSRVYECWAADFGSHRGK